MDWYINEKIVFCFTFFFFFLGANGLLSIQLSVLHAFSQTFFFSQLKYYKDMLKTHLI